MTKAFTTQFDRIPQRHRGNPSAVAEARAELMAQPAPLTDPSAVSPALSDPTLLRGTRIARVVTQTNRILIDFAVAFPDEPEDPDPESASERFAGPARLIAEDHPSLRCSGTCPAEPDPDDLIVWNELRADDGDNQPELILVCASGRHWSIRADHIGFASVHFPQ